jgi:signal transduction histidine kinase/DNA-binding response OmpR family regulator
MPEIDGFETASLIRQRARTRHIPIIFLTADSDEVRATRGYSLGAVDYIVCPFAPEVLRAKVKVFVELSKAQERLRREAEHRLALSRAEVARAAAEEESRRLRVLADISGALAQSLDAAALMADLLTRLVPRLGAVGAVVRCDEGGTETLWIAAGGEGERREPSAVEQIELQTAIDRVIARRQELLIEPGPGAMSWGAVFPLAAQTRLLGVLALARTGQAYAPAELDLLRLVASRAAAALENCRLYQEIKARDHQKDEFLAMISHELRNPLGAITTAVGLLDLIGAPGDRASRARSVIRRQSAHLARMVDDLIELTRLTSGQFEVLRSPLRLDELVERSVGALREAGRLERHHLTVRAVPVMVDVDGTRIEQVVTNLLVNALKYTDPGGRIVVEVEVEGDEAVLRVHDTGVGIAPDLLPHIFDLFTQARQTLDRSQGGLGIGLTLVRQLVEVHGGRVEASSEGPGTGSVFTVRLPRGTWVDAPACATEAATPVSQSLRVLVVEDNADVRVMLRAFLEEQGHIASAAGDGLEGLELALRLRPQIAFIDVGLPRLDGVEVAAGVRAAAGGDEIVLVALTGYGQEHDRRRTLAAGFDAHLLKPVDTGRLSQILAGAAEAASDPAALRAFRESLGRLG